MDCGHSSTWRGVRWKTGSWAWSLHGESKGGFASAHKAALDLARQLDVPHTALRKHNPTKVIKQSEIHGVYWLSGRLGWVGRTTQNSMTKMHFTEEDAANELKAPDKPAVRSREQSRSGFLYVWRAHDKASGPSWGYRVHQGKKTLLKTGFPTPLDAVDVVMLLPKPALRLMHPSCNTNAN